MRTEEAGLVAAFPDTYLTFRLGREVFGLEAKYLWEIATFVSLSPLPRNSSFLVGITHLHGKIIPVMDLNALLERAPLTDPGGFVAVKPFGLEALGGFLVSRVLGFERFPAPDIQPVPEDKGGRFLRGQASVQAGTLQLLDLERLWAGVRPATAAGNLPL